MSLVLKNPMWVVSNEGWEFATKDKNSMQYIEDNAVFIIESEYCFPAGGVLTVVYLDTIKNLENKIELNDIDKQRIKKNIIRALDLMGGQYEIC